MTIHVKILSLRSQERYLVRRLVLAALHELQTQFPGLQVEITEVGDPTEIGKCAQVLVAPSLVVEEAAVCLGRVPAREEVAAWLKQAAQGRAGSS